MTFKCLKCGYHVAVEGTDVCSQCARTEAFAFLGHVNNKTRPEEMSELHQKVWEAIVKDGRKWRVTSHYVKGCGHPSVKDTQNKCVFCRFQASLGTGKMTAKEQVIINLRRSAKDLRNRADEAEAKATAMELGYWEPETLSAMTPRQQAVMVGDKWYQSDEPCKHCGVAGEKYVANGRCRRCGN